MRPVIVASAIAAACLAAPASSAGRPLNVPADKGWQHAQTGLILTAELGEFKRTALEDSTDAELDVAATYDAPNRSARATIYIYRPGLFDLPIWFDRSHLAMAHNKNFTLGAQAGPVARFSTPGNATQNGLRVVHAMAGKPTGATGLAIAPVGDWLVAIRLTSDSKDGAGVDAALTDLIAKIRWPANLTTTVVPDPIQPCVSSPLKFKRAKVLKPDLGQSLLGAALVMAANGKEASKEMAGPAQTYCSEGRGSADYSVYRPVGTNNQYVIAFGDAGISASVYPQFSLDGRKGNYSVTLSDLDSSDSYPGFNALPEPAQVFAMVMKMSPVSSTAHGSKNITLSVPAK